MIYTNKAQNPMSEYLLKIKLIIDNTEYKNKHEANKYETAESKINGMMYVRAVNHDDIFEGYDYSERLVYTVLSHAGMSDDDIYKYTKNLSALPFSLKDKLLKARREEFISTYKEPNKYYQYLTGKPFGGDDKTPADPVLTIPDEFYEEYKTSGYVERNQPIHELDTRYQEIFMSTKYYKQMLKEYPNVDYLRYIGSNSIPIAVSRKANDGDIMRINTTKLSTYDKIFGQISVTPDIIHGYVNIYHKTRDYVYYTLSSDLSMIYENYDSFVRFLTIYLSIGNSLNEFMKKSTSMIYMNNVTANNFFMLYGLPSVVMEGTPMMDFLKKFRMILMDKGTNVVYRVKDLIGYEYTDIYTLVMVKQQVFENGVPVYTYDDQGNAYPKNKIVFRRLGTTDDNTSYFKFKESAKEYTVDEITSGDPHWWNTPEVEQMLQDMNYTLSNSKYIQLSTHVSMSDVWWQSVIFLRGLLDKKVQTDLSRININYNINGTSDLTIFDAVLVLVIIMNWHLKDFKGDSMKGEMCLPNGEYNGKEACLDLLFNGLNPDGSPKELVLGSPYKVSSFDFDVRNTKPEFYNSIDNMEYLEPDTFKPMLDKILDSTSENIGELIMTNVYVLFKYLETKLRNTRTISEFRQVTDAFSSLFLVDPNRDWYDNYDFDIDNILMDEYKLTESELLSLKMFFRPSAEPELYIDYNDKKYPINLYNILNNPVEEYMILGIYPFRDSKFVDAFIATFSKYVSQDILSSYLPMNIKNNYNNIIIDKVMLDVGNTANGPKTFESLLFRHNSDLYRYLLTIKNNGESLLLLMRSIVKALSTYTNSDLMGLEFAALGIDEYFNILKEVITYFKSYMVEFTKEEFSYIFDGLFDNGGNSNMLRLYDEINSYKLTMIPHDSATMFDVSKASATRIIRDKHSMYDECLFRIKTTYGRLLDTGYTILYDDGNGVTDKPFEGINRTDVFICDLYLDDENATEINTTQNPTSSAYKIIINIKNKQ